MNRNHKLFGSGLGLFASCMLIFTFLSCSKDLKVPEPDELSRWQKDYGTFYNEQLNDICITGNGHVLIGKTILVQNENEKLFLRCADDQGMELWRDTSSSISKTMECGYAVAVVDNKILAVVGKIVGGEAPQIEVRTYTMQGQFTDTTTITVDYPGTLALKAIHFTHTDANSSSLVVLDSLEKQDVCITYKFEKGILTIGSVLKLQGRVATNRMYLTEKDATTAFMALSITGDIASDPEYIRVSKINDNIFQWSYMITNELNYREQVAGVMYAAGLLTVGSSFHTAENTTGIALRSIREDGTSVGKVETSLKGVHLFHDCIQPAEDTIVLVGERQISSKGSNVFFATMHNNANLIDTVFYGNSGLSTGKFIRYLPVEKNFLIGGDLYNFTNTDVFTIKIDSKGDWTH